jgi:hypothetical protein
MSHTTGFYTAVGVFATAAEAEMALEDLRRAGFREEQLGFVARTGAPPAGTVEEVAEGAAAGAAGGGVAGAVAGLAVATGLLTPIGPAVAGGALAGILASTASGAAIGGAVGVVGTLLGEGVSEVEARHYERELAAGRALVTVRADDRRDEAVALLRRHGGRVRDESPHAESLPEIPVL